MSKQKIDLTKKLSQLTGYLSIARRYSFVIFIVFAAALYGFVLFKINSLGNAQPSDGAVTSQVQAAKVPQINQSLINQLQSLQDNSVNVQSLFNQTRSNPFQE